MIRSSKSAFLASVNYYSNLCLQVVHTSQIFNLNDLFNFSIISQFRELMFRIGFLWTCVANTFTCLRNKWKWSGLSTLYMSSSRYVTCSVWMFFFHFALLFPNSFKNKQHLFSSPKSHVDLRLPLNCPWKVLNLLSFQSLLGYLQYYNCQPFKCLTSWTINIARRLFKRLLYKIKYSLSHVFEHCV